MGESPDVLIGYADSASCMLVSMPERLLCQHSCRLEKLSLRLPDRAIASSQTRHLLKY